jgi:hypothetical protein
MIYLTGDLHGNWKRRLNTEAFPRQSAMTKEDYLIVLGDFGIWDSEPKSEAELDWVEHRPFTTLFLDGNHENFDLLESFPVTNWHGGKVQFIRPSVIHLMRGQTYDIEGMRFFVFGGARSTDVTSGILDPHDPQLNRKCRKLDAAGGLYRINHYSWWKQELPSADEMDEGLRNLKVANNDVDCILTHAAPSSIAAFLSAGMYKNDILTDYLETIKNTVRFKDWYFGHYHDDRELPYGDGHHYQLLYHRFLRIN